MPDYTTSKSQDTKTETKTNRSNPSLTPSNAAAMTQLHGRFAGDSNLERIMTSGGTLSSRDNGESVRKVQQALIDLGYSMPRFGPDGGYGSETISALKDFQGDYGLPVTGHLDRNTLSTLSRNAPTANSQTERFFDYGRLLADGKLEITVAFGADEHNIIPMEIAQFRQWVSQSGFVPTRGADGNSEYFQRPYSFQNNGQQVNADIVLRVILPGNTALDSYSDALQNDEVVYYAGHARYGSGPDFDHKESPDGNFVIGANSQGHQSGQLKQTENAHIRDVLSGQGNHLENISSQGGFQSNKYQVWAFGACSTINYLDELRGGLVAGKDTSNLDIMGTGKPIYLVNEADATISFIFGLLSQQSIQQMITNMNARSPEADWWQHGAGNNPTQR